jgi:hemerythrin
MAILEWNKKMSVGVESLDEDHRKMIAIINELQEGIQAGHKKVVLEQVLDELVEYTQGHFSREEALFAHTDYSGAAMHKSDHMAMIQRVQNLRTRLPDRPVVMLDLELMSFLQSWLVNHIQTTDKKYSAWLNSHGIF